MNTVMTLSDYCQTHRLSSSMSHLLAVQHLAPNVASTKPSAGARLTTKLAYNINFEEWNNLQYTNFSTAYQNDPWLIYIGKCLKIYASHSITVSCTYWGSTLAWCECCRRHRQHSPPRRCQQRRCHASHDAAAMSAHQPQPHQWAMWRCHATTSRSHAWWVSLLYPTNKVLL